MSTIWNANTGFYFELGNTATPKKLHLCLFFGMALLFYHISLSFLSMAAISSAIFSEDSLM